MRRYRGHYDVSVMQSRLWSLATCGYWSLTVAEKRDSVSLLFLFMMMGIVSYDNHINKNMKRLSLCVHQMYSPLWKQNLINKDTNPTMLLSRIPAYSEQKWAHFFSK